MFIVTPDHGKIIKFQGAQLNGSYINLNRTQVVFQNEEYAQAAFSGIIVALHAHSPVYEIPVKGWASPAWLAQYWKDRDKERKRQQSEVMKQKKRQQAAGGCGTDQK